MKTLEQIEARIIVNAANCPGDSSNQFIINTGGSYYLIGKILGVANKNGISIQSDNVTVDLNGFAVNGNVSSSLAGIIVPGSHANIAIRNGTVANWGGNGVDLSNANNAQIHHIRASNNSAGIITGYDSTVTNCTAYNNQLTGIRINHGTVANCSAFSNNGDGISTDYSTVTNCTSNNNHQNGITAAGSAITNCAASGNGDGFTVITSTVTNCDASLNNGYGISTDESTITNCTAKDNANGISGSVSTIANCTASNNTTDGIVVSSFNAVAKNQCSSNGGAGIHATAGTNKIEQNNVTSNDVGIQVDSSSNFIVGNSARGNAGTNGNYSIVAGNRIGTIVAPATSSASGNTGGTAISTDAWANIAY
jgi:parallel beta-helix repeat protein